MKPCPCGWFSDPQEACACAPAVVTKYQKRISGPLLDRIDVHYIEVPRVEYEKLSGNKVGETSEVIRQRVLVARDIQQARSRILMRSAMSQLNLSHAKCGTCAHDCRFNGSEEIQSTHLAEALQYSTKIMKGQ